MSTGASVAAFAPRRGAVVALSVALGLALAGCGASKSTKPAAAAPTKPGAASAASAPVKPGGAPSWLPAYSAEQEKLLTPVDHAIQERAPRTYPDLERFGYANNRRLADVRDAVKFTRLVATVLEDSPRFYVLGEARPELANVVAQYGPAPKPEADPWYVVKRDAIGVGSLVAPPGVEAGRPDYDKGEAARKKGDLAAAAAAYRDAAKKAPAVPVYHLALGDVLVAAKDDEGAKAAFLAAIAADPTLATGHVAMAEILSRTGDVPGARRAVAEALALHPASQRARAVADLLTSGAASAGSTRIHPWPVFVEVDAAGAIHADAPGGEPAALYASCRAVMRYEPGLRASIFGVPPETPYFLSVAEEVICHEAAIGAYAVARADAAEKHGAGPSDDTAEALLRLAREDGLSGYAMVEILGAERPERARMAPPDVHRAMLAYVDRYVLGGGAGRREGAPEGVLTASR
jgi:tetratricopeptide (TPR) repeat protein